VYQHFVSLHNTEHYQIYIISFISYSCHYKTFLGGQKMTFLFQEFFDTSPVSQLP